MWPTHAALLSATCIVPSDDCKAVTARGLHGSVVIEVDTLSLVCETILTIRTSQILLDGPSIDDGVVA